MESVYDSLVSFGETNPRAKLSPDITNVLDNMLGGRLDAAENAAREAKLAAQKISKKPMLNCSTLSDPLRLMAACHHDSSKADITCCEPLA